MTRVDEVVLRTLVIQFDGRVVEVFGSPSGDVLREHVALMKEPDIQPPVLSGQGAASSSGGTAERRAAVIAVTAGWLAAPLR